MNTEKIFSFAKLMQKNPSTLIWTTLSEVAELSNTILADKIDVEYDWFKIFIYFDGVVEINPVDKTTAINTVRLNIGDRYENTYVQSSSVVFALLGLAYILDTSGYNLIDASWERIQSNILGAYHMQGIQL